MSRTPDPPPPGAAPPAIEVSGLAVRAGGRTLLRDASFSVRAGEVVVVVGPSGTGKSVLLKILAGLVDERTPGFEIRGTGRVAGREIGRPGAAARLRGRVGIVFQDFALFDELTPRQNLAFAWDHAREKPGPRDETVAALARELDLDLDTPIRAQSAGQRQRLALARTLAFNPEVLLFDEPSSGLDPRNARAAAGRIRDAARTRGKACVVVTHDYPNLLPAADRVLWLDPRQGALEEVAAADLEARALAAEPGTPPTPAGRASPAALALAAAAWAAVIPEAALEAARFALPLWPRAKWGLRYFLHYAGLVASPGAFLYVAAAGSIAGFVSTYFTFEHFPYRSYAEPLLAEEVVGSLGFLLYRIVVPVLATVLVAARCGAAVAADAGNRSWSGSAEAMRSLGADPRRYLYTGILWAFLAGTPLMTAAAFLAGRAASLAAFLLHHPAESPWFWDLHFHRFIAGPSGGFPYEGTGWLLAKVLACAALVAVAAWRRGSSPKASVVSVNRGITSTVILATLLVLLAHLAFAFFEFKAPGSS
jgi:ABC-type multidrug transport system ATPase subunit/ABC-type transporter Mla maintaining outer membrane lipid asymmetry permease subunit MlaE